MNNNENKALPSGLREAFEAWGNAHWAMGLDTVYVEHRQAYADDIVDAAWQAYQAAHNAQQAIIDGLMLEHCPDEMTAEQVRIWGDSQRCVEEDL